ncbi:MAG: S8/S53 family peptidase [Gluconacetobacter diazotrophicus]|nr:S8/S53 family peptidase [Gluconacetobacter diazotrophicus]
MAVRFIEESTLTFRKSLLAGAVIAVAAPFGLARAAPTPVPASATTQAVTVAPRLRPVAPAAASQPVQFDVVLPLRNAAALDGLLAAQQDPASPSYHRWLTPAQFSARFGPSAATMAAAAAQLRMLGFQVTPRSRSLHATGTAATVDAAFNTTLTTATDTTGQPRLVSGGPLTWPTALSMLGAVVPAFGSSAFTAAPFMHRAGNGYMHRAGNGYGAPTSAAPPSGSLFFDDLRQAYDFPSYRLTVGGGPAASRLDGTGTTVAVLMSSDVLDSDVEALFAARNFAAAANTAAEPRVAMRVPVNGGNGFSADNDTAEEATLDVEQVLGAAPGTRLQLYVTPDLGDPSLISALAQIDEDDGADVVSMSFGQCERYYTAAYNNGQDQTVVLRTFSELFKQGNAQGITFVAASGDSGGLGCIGSSYFNGQPGSFTAGVSVPAADPNVTAVGGTNLSVAAANGGTGSAYANENAWSDPEVPYDPYGLGTTVSGGVWGAGGGVSSLYARPAYQDAAGIGDAGHRAVPDLGMQAGGCPDIATAPCNGGNSAVDGAGNTDRSALTIAFNGTWDAVIGTSAAAPQVAGIVALLVEGSGRQGNINPLLYAMARGGSAGGASPFRQDVPGFNGIATNGGSYNFTTGNGTLDVARFLGLGDAERAGAPGTPSNP